MTKLLKQWIAVALLLASGGVASAADSSSSDEMDVAAAFGDRSVARNQAWGESRPYLTEAARLGRAALAAERKNDLAGARWLYKQAEQAAGNAQIAYGKRGFGSVEMPSDINFMVGATKLDCARLYLVLGYRPVNMLDKFSNDPSFQSAMALTDLQYALERAQIDQYAMPNAKRQRQIDAINEAMGYARLLLGQLNAAKQNFQQTPSSSPQYAASQVAVQQISDATKKRIQDAMVIGIELVKAMFPKYSGVASAIVTFLNDFA